LYSKLKKKTGGREGRRPNCRLRERRPLLAGQSGCRIHVHCDGAGDRQQIGSFGGKCCEVSSAKFLNQKH